MIDQKFLPEANKLLDFVAEKEPWNEYRLENGTIIRAKIIMTEIIDTGEFTPDGKPVYRMNWQHVIHPIFPPQLLKKGDPV